MELLKDVQTLNFDLLLLATLIRGRLCWFLTGSSAARVVLKIWRSTGVVQGYRDDEPDRVLEEGDGIMLVLIAFPGDIG